MHDTDRRRLFLAALVTLLAVPAFFIYNRASDDDGSGDESVATVAPVEQGDLINPLPDQGDVINPLPEQVESATVATEVATSNQSQLPPIEPPDDDPIFMNGPVAIDEDEIAEVAIPAQPEIAPLMIDATYLSTVPGTRSCIVRGIETGRTVTVTNLDRGSC